MRKFFCFFFIVFAFSATIYGQRFDYPVLLNNKRLNLEEDQKQAIIEIQDETSETIKKAQIEMKIIEAQLAKLLYPPDVDMTEVRILLEGSLEWKLEIQLAAIEARVKLRLLLGDRKFEEFSALQKEIQKRLNQNIQRRAEQDSSSGRSN